MDCRIVSEKSSLYILAGKLAVGVYTFALKR